MKYFKLVGYKLLRGFNEESIYTTQYAVGSGEFRYLVGLNAYLFSFVDYGWARNDTYETLYSNTYLGTGFGLALETKAGMLNLSFAVGKTGDESFNLKQSKIHFGFVSIF
jgi:hemolysin activation/secretion protein